MKKSIMIIAAGAVLAFGFSPARAAEHSHGNEHLHKVQSGQGREDLTLIKIMQDLAHNIGRIQAGILAGNRYMVEEGAKAIADHPMPKGGLKPYMKQNAEKIKDVVPEYDAIVHKTSLELAKVAATASEQDMQQMLNRMAEGCVSCHEVFRGPLNR